MGNQSHKVDWQHGDKWSQNAIHFKLSHTLSLIACGVTSDSPIIIDVEEIQRRLKHSILSFARRYFTDDEMEYLSGISDSEVQKRELLKLWTIKAILHVSNRSPTSKGFLGRGFSGAPLKTFNIRYKTSQKKVPEIMVKSIDSAVMNL